MHKNVIYVSLGLTLTIGPCFADDPHYLFETKDFPGAISTAAGGINNLGQIAGFYLLPGSPAAHAFYEVDGVLQTVPGTGDNWLGTYSNLQGILVGQFFDAAGVFHSFARQSGVIKPFPDVNLPGVSGVLHTEIDYINEAGNAAVGVYGVPPTDSSLCYGPFPCPVARLAIFRRNPGTTDVTQGVWTKIPDFPDANLYGICGQGPTDNGWIWGEFSTKDASWGFGNCPGPGVNHGFVLSPGGAFTQIDYPGSVHQTNVFGLNNRGDIVGMYSDGSTLHGFLLSAGHYSTVDHPGAILTSLTGITDRGEIVGWYQMPGDRNGCDSVPPDTFCGNLHTFVAHQLPK